MNHTFSFSLAPQFLPSLSFSLRLHRLLLPPPSFIIIPSFLLLPLLSFLHFRFGFVLRSHSRTQTLANTHAHMAAIIVVVPACLTLFVTRTHTHTHTVARRKVANSQAPAKLLEKSARDAANTSKQFIRHRRTASTELCRLTYEWKQQLPVRHIAGNHESKC